MIYTRVRELLNAHPPSTAPPFRRINLEPSQATASKRTSHHSGRDRVGCPVGLSASSATVKSSIIMYPVKYAWYKVFTYSSDTFHRRCLAILPTRVGIKKRTANHILFDKRQACTYDMIAMGNM